MSTYRLVLIYDDGEPSRTGYVFCANHGHARSAAQALLEFHPEALAVEVYDDDGSVCRLERPAPVQMRMAS